MGTQTIGAILYSGFCVAEIASAGVTQGVKRAVAKQAAEGVRVCSFMAWKIFTTCVLVKFVVRHRFLLKLMIYLRKKEG